MILRALLHVSVNWDFLTEYWRFSDTWKWSQWCAVFVGETLPEPQITTEEQPSVYLGYIARHVPAFAFDIVQIWRESETDSAQWKWIL